MEEGTHTQQCHLKCILNVVAKYELIFGGPLQEFKSPMKHTYHLESDDTLLLAAKDALVYQCLIGSANWIITIG